MTGVQTCALPIWFRVFGRLEAVGDVLLEHGGVDRDVDPEKNRAREEPREKEVLGRPEEVHALQEPEEERRIAEGRQRPTHVRHEEDEEDESMELALATFVRLDERTDEEHRRARRPHEVREHRPEREKARVDDRTPDEGSTMSMPLISCPSSPRK